VEYVEVHGTAFSWIAPTLWPKELRWVQERLNIRSGSPRFIVVEGDKLLIHRFGTGGWSRDVLPLVERLVAERAALR
jgi:hypothetical protein